MDHFYALTGPGCLSALEKELSEIDIHIKPFQGGALFDGDWRTAYRINLRSRTASRVIKVISTFKARTNEELYREVQKHDFTQWIDPDQYLSVEATTQNSELRDQRWIALKTKDAIVDQFRDKYGVRPSVDTEDAELQVWIRFHNNEAIMGLNMTGEPLFKRGYRKGEHPAPIKEHVAASLIKLTGWDGKSPLLDPMCGSGTFLIEGALMALNISPGTLRSHFAFQKWKNFDKELWEDEVQKALDLEIEDPGFKFYGFDIDRDAVKAAKQSVHSVGLGDLIDIKRGSVDLFEPPEEKGTIIINPPYGERLGKDEELLKDVYRDLGFALKTRFKGWTAWILSPNRELINLLGMKATTRFEVWNGPLPCEFLRYDIFR